MSLCQTKVGAWYVSSPEDISDLEKARFNLFFYTHTGFGDMPVEERDDFIQQGIDALGACSQLILPIDHLLLKGWHWVDGMEAFIYKWGQHPKVYGFLLKDDVATAPFPDETNIDPSALWKYRWFYRMIRNTADDQRNSYDKDIAPGKKIIVTLPFQLEIHNPISRFQFASRYPLENTPPRFFIPGDAWDIVMPYWHPHRRQISVRNEDYTMDVLYKEMAEAFPSGARIPIIQAAAEIETDQYSLEHQENGYDLIIQYNKLVKNGLIDVGNRSIFYYTANGHATVYDNLLHKDRNRDVSEANIYYREASKLNGYHFSLFDI